MGGPGSGRKDRTTEVINSMKGQQFEPKAPIATEMFLPNVSNVQDFARKDRPESKFTKGSVLFADTNGVPAQNNSKLFWDNSNNRLGIGINSPSVPLEITGDTAPFLKISADAGNTEAGFTVFENTNTGVNSGAGFLMRSRRDSVDHDAIFFVTPQGGGQGAILGIRVMRSDGALRNIVTMSSSEVRFNNNIAGIDFQIRANADFPLLFVDVSEGNIGIRTDSPVAPLHIIADINDDEAIRLQENAQSGTRFMNLNIDSNGNLVIAGASAAIFTINQTGGAVLPGALTGGGAGHDQFSDFVANEHLLPAAIDHDVLLNFVANEHIDWTSTSSNFSTTGTLTAGKGTTTTDNSSGNITISSGNTLTHPLLNIQSAHTYTNEGSLLVFNSLNVDGLLINNGSVYIHD